MWALEKSLSRPHTCRILGWSKRRNFVPRALRKRETSLFRPHPNRILAGQEAENDIAVPGDHLKHRFINITELHFSWPRGGINSKVPWEHLKHRFIDFILGLSRDRKWLLSAFRPLETSPYRLEKSRNFGWSRSRKWLQSFIRSLHRFLDFAQVAFWASQEAEIEFSVPWNQLNHRLLELNKAHFVVVKRQNEFGVPGNDLKHY